MRSIGDANTVPVRASQIVVVRLIDDHSSYLERINAGFHRTGRVERNSYRIIGVEREI